MDVLVLIDKLDDLVHNAKSVPMTDQVRVDKEEIYDILDQYQDIHFANLCFVSGRAVPSSAGRRLPGRDRRSLRRTSRAL